MAISGHLGSSFFFRSPSSFLNPLRPHPCPLTWTQGRKHWAEPLFLQQLARYASKCVCCDVQTGQTSPPGIPMGPQNFTAPGWGEESCLPPIAPGRKEWLNPHSQALGKTCPRSEPCRAHLHGVVLPTPHQSKGEEVLEPHGGERAVPPVYHVSLKPWGPAQLKGSAPPIHLIPLCPALPHSTSNQKDCLLPATEAGFYTPCSQHRPVIISPSQSS